MLLDADLLFEDLVDFAFYRKSEDGEVLEFYEDVEYEIDEFDDIIILKRKETLKELESLRAFALDKNDPDLIATIDRRIEIANKEGVYESYACVHDDRFYDLHSFSF